MSGRASSTQRRGPNVRAKRRPGCAHDLDRARSVKGHRVRHGAQEELAERAVSFGAHDDQVCLPAFRLDDDELPGRAFACDGRDPEPGRPLVSFLGGSRDDLIRLFGHPFDRLVVHRRSEEQRIGDQRDRVADGQDPQRCARRPRAPQDCVQRSVRVS